MVIIASCALLAGCVGSTSYLEEAAQTSNQANSVPTVTQAPVNPEGFTKVPMGRALPSPKSASNYLPEEEFAVSTNNSQPGETKSDSSLLLLQTGQTSTEPNTPFSLASLEQNNNAPGVSIGISSDETINPIERAAAKRVNKLYNQIDHGKCNTKWSPKPKRIEAKRINPGDPFYIELRMRNTPLMPVGHTFIVYGRLDGSGKPIDEKMAMLAPAGGYAGASLAAAVPVKGVLKPYGDDCKIRPETAYRVSLNAQKFERLLLAIQDEKRRQPVYMLFAQNCNHFTQRMADAVGILPPRNKYVPAVDYLYDLIEANEGIRIDRRFRSKIAGVPDWPESDFIKRQRRTLAN